MVIIANNGNLKGSTEFTYTQKQVELALKTGYDVKIDISLQDNGFFSGKDSEHKIDIDFLREHVNGLWIACYNLAALDFFNNDPTDFNCYWFWGGDYMLTSHQHIIALSHVDLPKHYGVSWFPELNPDKSIKDAWGIITDFPSDYRKSMNQSKRKKS